MKNNIFINIKEYVAKRKSEIAAMVAKRQTKPQIAIIQVGDLEASNRYVRNKIKDCDEVGIKTIHTKLPENTSASTLKNVIDDFNNDPATTGVFVQLPVPDHLESCTQYISPYKDVDGLLRNSSYMPCTAKGIMRYLEACEFDLTGKHVVIIGRSEIVGKPLAKAMTDANATVTLCHSRTKNLDWYTQHADLIVCAVGKAKFLNCYPIYCPVIDVGINFDHEGKMVGDCFNTEGREVTPVPGGVGLLTRVGLLENAIGE